MTNDNKINKDERFDQIKEQIIRYTQLNFNGCIPVSKEGDEIDAIIIGLNTLGEELSVLNLPGVIS